MTGVSGSEPRNPAAPPSLLRVLYIIDSLAPGGAERSLVEIAPHLRERGIDLDVAVLYDRPGLSDELQRSGVSLSSLAGAGGRHGWLQRAVKHVSACDPDLVHTTLFESDLIGRLAGRLGRRPVVSSLVTTATTDEVDRPWTRRWRWYGARAADVATSRFVTRFHAVSAAAASTMARRLLVPERRIEVIPRGRDSGRLGEPSSARRAAVRANIGLGPDDIAVLAVARHEYAKGLDILLGAVPSLRLVLPDVRVLIAGSSGRHTAHLENMIRLLRIDNCVTFLGYRDDVPDLLCAADVFVLSSRREGMPGAALEAMAMGTAIVASRIPSVQEVLPDDNFARLVAVGDVGALARAIAEAVLDAAGSLERAAHARARFESNYAIGPVADRMVAFYQRAVRSK
jgi:glycosyltransferase involved in cell wall biosynthesis